MRRLPLLVSCVASVLAAVACSQQAASDPDAAVADTAADAPGETSAQPDADADPVDASDPDAADAADAPADAPNAERCDLIGRARPASDDVALYAWGERGTSARVPLAVEGDACAVVATSDQEWLRAWVADGELHVGLWNSLPPVGVLDATVSLSANPAENATSVRVRLRSFALPAADALPHVLFIGIDGMRPDSLLAANTPHMDGIRDLGAWTLDGTTHTSTRTDSSAGWTTLFTGVESDRHGVTSNDAQLERDWSLRTFAHVARVDHGVSTAMAAQWLPAAAILHEPDAFDLVWPGDGATVATKASEWLAQADHRLVMTHFDDVDHAGHASGFSPANPDYIAAIEDVDAHVGRLLDALAVRPGLAGEDWLIVVVTDLGGEGTDHGPQNFPNQRIPFLFASARGPAGELAPGVVTHVDVFPTVLSHLEIEVPAALRIEGVARAVSSAEVTPGATPPAVETACGDRVDQDGDRAIDCDDPDCTLAPGC